jgi:lipopolysaccharide/colanic/teichoic acid biosynthesis glycosyltransferase
MRDKPSTDVLSTNRMSNGIPRSAEFVLSLVGLIIFTPLLALSALAIILSSPGPVIFRQKRVGRGGQSFVIYKLRTMHQSNAETQIARAGDRRIFRIGKVLRRTKIDELPQLWNILKGDMSLVGPRPEVPCYVDLHNATWKQVLRVKPGLTHPMTLLLTNEERLLSEVRDDPESFYLSRLQPFKLKGYLGYLNERSWQSDVRVLWDTVLFVITLDDAARITVHELSSYSNELQ